MDNFGDHPQAFLVYLFFVAATFISQLTMLNMLIAIMGDSFSKVIENSEVNSIKMKLEILSAMSVVLDQQEAEEKRDVNFVLVRFTDGEGDDTGEDWEGTVRQLTRVVEKNSRMTQKRVMAKCEKILSIVEENAKREALKSQMLRTHFDSTIKSQSTELNSKIDRLMVAIERRNQ